MLNSWALRARESFWFLPAVLGVAAIVVAEALVWVDRALIDHGATRILFLDALTATGGRSILTIIGTSMLTVAGTSFSITISVLATTSSTYGPRLVRNFLADRANQLVLAVFTSTFLYALVVLRSVRTAGDDGSGGFVPVVAIHVAVIFGIADVAVLVFFIHHIADSVQITTLQRRVQADLVRVVDLIYPEKPRAQDARDAALPEGPRRRIPAAADGYVEQIDLDRLTSLAAQHDARLRILAMPGAHVIVDEPLVEIVLSASRADAPIDDALARSVRAAFSLGPARTPHQDIGFALQQLVGVAVRGLASGTNDPYTAVTALDFAASGLVPLLQRPAAASGLRDGQGVTRVVVEWPQPVELLRTVFDGVDTYGLEHPLVVDAALRLARRLDAVAGADTRPFVRETAARLESLSASS